MIPEYEKFVAFKLSKEQRQQIEQLVHEGKFKSISELLRTALDIFLSKQRVPTSEPETPKRLMEAAHTS